MLKKTIVKRSTTLILILTVLFYLLPNTTFSQGANATEAASFEPVDATDMVNLVTGDLSYVLPLLNIPSPEGGYPIALSYHAGIAMDQEASWVGLGWSLNPGAINRGVNGYPDDWGKTNVNEFFYDHGWTENYYSFGAGVSFNGSISVGLGLSWGSNQSMGGFVSASIGIGGKGSPGIGGSIGTNGVSLNAGVNGFSASIGTNGVGLGYATDGNTAVGVSLNYNYNSGLSGGISVSQNNGTFQGMKGGLGKGVGRYSGVGINFSSSGVSVNVKTNGYGAGISTSTNSINSGDYDVSISTSGFYIPAYIFYISYSHTKVKYSLYKYNNLYTSGMLYPVASNKLQPYDNSSNLSRWMYENHFMDVNVIQKFGSDNSYDELIEDSNKNDRNNLILPNYDNYSVNAQGLSGTISPYIHSELNLSAKGRGEQNTDNEYVQYLNHDITEYMAAPSSGLGGNKEAIAKKYFTFTSAYNSFLRLETSQINKKGIFTASSDNLMKEYQITETNNFKYPKKREGNFIETYTNKEIRENSIVGFINAKEGNGVLNRQDTNVFLDDGIGAFKITTLDGKTYHYSLPVYQFESFYKNFQDATNQDKNFLEIQKTTPYATHWLLTAITGPDYIDKNNNGKVDETDYGYWVEFDYGKWSDGFIWQTPNGRFEENVDKTDPTKKTYSYSWGRKQIYYLDAIKTRTHTALFVKDLRNDNNSIQKIKYEKKWDQNTTFNPSSNGKKITQQKSFIIPTEGEYFSSTGGNINLEKSCLNEPYYYTGRKSTVTYLDIPKNYSLKLSKIIVLKNEESTFNKQTGSLITPLKGNYFLDNIYTNVFKGTNAYDDYGYCNTGQIQDLYLKASKFNQFDMQLHQNVVDVKDIQGLNLENKASQVIEFNYDYSLAKNAPNNEVSSGRLTLNTVSFKGKQGVQVVPPYQFNYFNSSLTYNKDHIDDWGYNKFTPQSWSLNEIITPTGGKIKIDYESDTFFTEAYKVIEVLASTTGRGFINITNINTNTGVISLNKDPFPYFKIGQYYKFIYYDPRSWDVTCNNCYPFVEKASFKVVDIGINWIKFEDLDPAMSVTSLTVNFYGMGNLSGVNKNTSGGGIRTKSITLSDELKNIVTTVYDFGRGITSYAPSKEQKGIPYVSELPPPMVMYEKVTMKNYDSNNILLGSTAYEFETLEPRRDEPGYIFSLGEAFRVKENQDQIFENGKVIANKYTIESKLGNLGRIKSITSYNNKNQVLNKIENTYKQNLDADGEIGVTQESHSSYKRVKKNNVEKFYISSTSKVNYPSVLESVKETRSGFSIEKHFDKYDFLTGQLLETRTYASDGTAFKTKTVPAYTKYPQMGSKVDNITNKNMLTQQAANYTYLLDEVNNTEKVIGVGITTWNNEWTYRDHSGYENTPTNNIEKIWRKHKSFFWKGDIDSDGAYVGFNSNNDDGFNWGVGATQINTKWKQASEIKRYDHYSAPLETIDINNNYASTKMCDKDSKILAVSNARYTEMFYSGAEYITSNSSYFDGEVKSTGRNSTKAHTGKYSVMANVNQAVFEVLLKTGEHRAGKYKVTVWVNKTNYLNARINIKGIIQSFNGEKVIAGDWVLLTHYEDLSSNAEIIFLTSANGTVYFDDFRLLPLASSMTSNVYNEWDELWYIIGSNGLATKFEYDAAGRLIKTYSEVIDAPSVTGGFKKVAQYNYNYKLLAQYDTNGNGQIDEFELFKPLSNYLYAYNGYQNEGILTAETAGGSGNYRYSWAEGVITTSGQEEELLFGSETTSNMWYVGTIPCSGGTYGYNAYAVKVKVRDLITGLSVTNTAYFSKQCGTGGEEEQMQAP